VTTENLAMFAHGTVKITEEPSFKDAFAGPLQLFIPAECSLASRLSSVDVERVRLMSCYLY